jgi:dTDP-4-dehydrorhamnose 3,5-epimerase
MLVEKCALDGAFLIRPRIFEDSRGFFFESYNENAFREAGLPTFWRQDNHSRSQYGTVRGLHFQRGGGQYKLVRCTRGRVFDVIADIRPDSPRCGQWCAVELSEDSKSMLFIPGEFAHGFAVLSADADVIYKTGTVYDPALEDEIKWNDPDIGVQWPFENPVLSARDQKAKSFQKYLNAFRH